MQLYSQDCPHPISHALSLQLIDYTIIADQKGTEAKENYNYDFLAGNCIKELKAMLNQTPHRHMVCPR
jgi:hypothetical protein